MRIRQQFVVISYLMLTVLAACVSTDTAAPPTTDEITSYAECVTAGYTVTRSYPSLCMAGEKPYQNPEHLEEIRKNVQLNQFNCLKTCGNGICEEVVCQAEGCPCPEDADNCPQDCLAQPKR